MKSDLEEYQFETTSENCGLFNYTLKVDSIDESLLSLNPQFGASFDFSELSEGLLTNALIEQSLVDYPTVVALTGFRVKVYTWQWRDAHDQVYKIGDSVLSLHLDYKALPDQDLFTLIEVISTGGEPIPDFASFNHNTNILKVQTDSNLDAGIYNLTMIASFPEFLGTNITSNFTLIVMETFDHLIEEITTEANDRTEAKDTIEQTEDLIKEVIEIPENLIGFKVSDKLDSNDKTPPNVWVKKINQLGVVTVSFSEYMFDPNYQEIAKSEIEDLDRRELASEVNSTEYDDMQYFWFNFKDKLLELSISDNEHYEYPRDLRFKWIVKEYWQN